MNAHHLCHARSGYTRRVGHVALAIACIGATLGAASRSASASEPSDAANVEAAAAVPPTPAEAPPTPAEAPVHVSNPYAFWEVDVGFRTTFVRSSGFDPFSTDDTLLQWSLGGSRTLLQQGRLSLALGLNWDYGASEATARGAKSGFRQHRITAPIEGRYHAAPWFFGFARLAPGVAIQTATLNETSAPAQLYAEKAVFTADASLGVTALFGVGRLPGRFGLTGDIGYSFSPDMALRMKPDLADDDPRRVSSVDLGSVSTRGAFFRLALAAAF